MFLFISLHPCALDESSLSFGRVKLSVIGNEQSYFDNIGTYMYANILSKWCLEYQGISRIFLRESKEVW